MEATEPHYFGSPEKQLLGIYHPPNSSARAHGVLLCPPGPQEYMRTHWAFRKLANLLVREGFHALRFDYYGTGDSAGATQDGNLAEWRDNIVTAASELRDCSDVKTISVLGFRLGAALAAQTSLDTANLLLWDPVVNGRQYLDELRRTHVSRFSDLLFPPPLPPRGCGGELLGLVHSSEMEADLEGIDLLAGVSCQAERVALLVSEERPEFVSLYAQLEATGSSKGTETEYHYVPDESSSRHEDGVLLSMKILHALVGVLTRRTE
jgi:pimeloyl-ACP methyl ester carboxylesterase